jgi:hypothetical protein
MSHSSPRHRPTGASRGANVRSELRRSGVDWIGARLRTRCSVPTDRRPAGCHRATYRRPWQRPAASGPARRDRDGQDRDAGLDHRPAQQADAGVGPQQDARRAALRGVPRVLPEQRRRVLRQLLRLLPARGVPAAQRHLYREGFIAQRRDRPASPRRDPRAVRASGRHHRRERLVHLRIGCAGGLRGDGPQAAGRRQVPRGSASGATPSSCSRRRRSSSSASSSSATRSSASPSSIR